MLMPAPDVDQRRAARSLYWRYWPVSAIAEELGLKRSTVQSWKDRDEWDKAPMIERIETCIEARLMTWQPRQGETEKI